MILHFKEFHNCDFWNHLFDNHTMTYKFDFLNLSIQNLGRTFSRFSKVLVFEKCKNNKASGTVQWFQLQFRTHTYY